MRNIKITYQEDDDIAEVERQFDDFEFAIDWLCDLEKKEEDVKSKLDDFNSDPANELNIHEFKP